METPKYYVGITGKKYCFKTYCSIGTGKPHWLTKQIDLPDEYPFKIE